MFTGIVTATGRVRSFRAGRLLLDLPSSSFAEDWELGESVAVNGVCLTVVSFEDALAFDLSEETLKRTALADLQTGSVVNLERAMRLADRLGGHIVQGHVDCVGQVVSITPQEQSATVRFKAPAEYDRYLIDKGSVCVDGISLTVIEPLAGEFDTAIIPHTLASTNLGERKPGERVNLEFDVLAKHVEKLISARLPFTSPA